MRSITNNDYFTDGNGEIRLKPEIALTTHWDFTETFQRIADNHYDEVSRRHWFCQVVHGESFLECGYVALVAIPEDDDYCYYAVRSGPVEVRTPENALRNEYAEVSLEIVKVKYENGRILQDSHPMIRACAEIPGKENTYDPAILSQRAVELLQRLHPMYRKTLELHRRMKDEGMI